MRNFSCRPLNWSLYSGQSYTYNFFCGLYKDIVSSSEFIASKFMISEQLTG
jgi:hypothetical protein